MGLRTRILECFGVRAVVRLDDVVDLAGRKDPDDLRAINLSIAASCTAVAVSPYSGGEGQ